MTRTRALALLAALTAAVAIAAPEPAPTITASDAWIALGPPGSTPLAGYLSLRNAGGSAAALVGIGSPAFGRIEIHSTVADGGTMRMRRLSKLEVPAGGRVVLGPGRLHLMLFAPGQPLVAGQRIALVLSFDDGRSVQVEAEVRDPRMPAQPHQHHPGS